MDLPLALRDSLSICELIYGISLPTPMPELILLTSAQRSAEVRALQCALSFYLYFYLSFGVCVSAVCGLCFTDFRQVAFFLQAKISGEVFRKAVTLLSKDGKGEIHPSSDIESQKSPANSGGTIV